MIFSLPLHHPRYPENNQARHQNYITKTDFQSKIKKNTRYSWRRKEVAAWGTAVLLAFFFRNFYFEIKGRWVLHGCHFHLKINGNRWFLSGCHHQLWLDFVERERGYEWGGKRRWWVGKWPLTHGVSGWVELGRRKGEKKKMLPLWLYRKERSRRKSF